MLSPVITQREFLWSDQEQALYIPVHQDTSAFGPVVVGWIKRGFDPKSYKTLRIAQKPLWGLYRHPGATPLPDRPLCLTEDVLSALRVSPIMDALACCGTELHSEAATFILTEGYSRAIIFLDADNPTVRMKAREMAKKLPIPTSLVETGKDPKHYPEAELRTILGVDRPQPGTV